MDIRDIFVYYSACIKSRYNFSIGYRSSTSAMELIEMFVREFFPRLKKRALGNYRSNLRKSIRGHFQLSIPLFESFEEENFVNNIISFRHFARRKCFSKQLFFPRIDRRKLRYSVSNRIRNCYRIYLNANALVTLYTVVYRRVSLSRSAAI